MTHKYTVLLLIMYPITDDFVQLSVIGDMVEVFKIINMQLSTEVILRFDSVHIPNV